MPSLRKPAVIAITSTIVVAGAIAVSAMVFGLAVTMQLVTTLLIPAAVIVLFWVAAKQVISEREAESTKRVELASTTARATNEFLASVAHELEAHPEKTSLRAEALSVAMEYRDLSEDIKVAVPDTVVMTDPLVLTQIMHTFVSNAVLHGGNRIAIWGDKTETGVSVTVSDDGPGIAKDVGDHLFERFVDLGASALDTRAEGSGLAIARELAGVIEGELTYRRDATWTHFCLTIPALQDPEASKPEKVEFEAQVG